MTTEEKELELFEGAEDMTEEVVAEAEEKLVYDFFATEDYEAFGYVTEEGYPVEPSLLTEGDLFFIYQLALADKESRAEMINSIEGLKNEAASIPEPSRIQLIH